MLCEQVQDICLLVESKIVPVRLLAKEFFGVAWFGHREEDLGEDRFFSGYRDSRGSSGSRGSRNSRNSRNSRDSRFSRFSFALNSPS